MPQSLVNEFFDQRASGNKLGSSLKEAIFQAKPPDLEVGEVEDAKPRFKLWKIRMRGLHDDDPIDWWFASTGIPILAATLGPLANVLSIGALVTYWRIDLVDPMNPGQLLAPTLGELIPDPRWCYWVNVVSLILGFVGNLFLLLNFTQHLRYLIALPLTVSIWFLACGIMVGDLASMKVHTPPIPPTQQFSGGYWYGIAAAAIYLLLAVMLMVNLIGYVRGHYPQHFQLSEDQRTLIVQTMMFFLWLAGGAGIYSRIEGWHYIDALYYCDVTILTVGFGDLYPMTNAGRAILIPYSIGGIITLGLVIQAIYRAVQELGEKNISRHHFEQQRQRTSGQAVRSSLEMQRREIEIELANERAMAKQAARPSARSTATGKQFTAALGRRTSNGSGGQYSAQQNLALSRQSTMIKKKQIVLLKEEKERFEAMRKIQKQSQSWRNWFRLAVTLGIFAIFWLIGAVFFWAAERGTTQQSYWETIYFCWVAIVSIGYGDFAPKTGAGRCFFIIWSLLAVPTMTILAGDLSSTVVSLFKSGSNALTDFTIMPQEGRWRELIDTKPWLFLYIPTWLERRAGAVKRAREEKRAQEEKMNGHAKANLEDDGRTSSESAEQRDDRFAAGTEKADLADLVDQHARDVQRAPDARALARQLALAIRRTAQDMQQEQARQYSYEEWVEFTRLIRFSAVGGAEALREEDEEGMVEWDWIGEDSPMMTQGSESQFVLERLVESLVRYLRRNPPARDFSERLKERGEDALKLSAAAGREGDADTEADPELDGASTRTGGRSINTAITWAPVAAGWNTREGVGAGRAVSLHPLDEEREHEVARPEDDIVPAGSSKTLIEDIRR